MVIEAIVLFYQIDVKTGASKLVNHLPIKLLDKLERLITKNFQS